MWLRRPHVPPHHTLAFTSLSSVLHSVITNPQMRRGFASSAGQIKKESARRELKPLGTPRSRYIQTRCSSYRPWDEVTHLVICFGSIGCSKLFWFSRWWRRPTPQRRWVLSVRWTGAIRWWSTAKSPWKPLRSAVRTAGSCLTRETWPTTSSPSLFSETLCSECGINVLLLLGCSFLDVSAFFSGSMSHSCSTMWPGRRSHTWTHQADSSARTNQTELRWRNLFLTSSSLPGEWTCDISRLHWNGSTGVVSHFFPLGQPSC